MTVERDAFAETISAPADDTVPSVEVEARAESIAEGTHVGRFIVLDALGAGGFSVVYRAFDPRLNRVVALKLLRAKGDEAEELESRRDRLLREAQALAAVSHPNIVAVHDAGTHDEEVFLAMELVAGSTVVEWTRRSNRSIREIVEAFCGACDGLAAAHEAGLVHRDVKPSNMIVTDEGQLKVLDFGLARAAHELAGEAPPPGAARSSAVSSSVSAPTDKLRSDITRAGVVIGTPAYMAPEQHEQEPATPLSDQYSLCLSIYRTLYGELPFNKDDAAKLREEIVTGAVKDAPRGTKVPRRLRAILLRGMSREPAKRYASVAELGAELRRFLGRRRRLARLVALAAGFAILGGAIGFAVFGRDASAMCTGTERHWEGVWDDGVASTVRASFAATGKPHASGTFERVAQGMTDYRDRWIDAHRETCRATHVFGELSEAELDRRMACLDRKLAKAQTLVAALRSEDTAEVLDKAVPAVQGLPTELMECSADADALAALTDPARRRYDELRRELDRLDVMLKTGRLAEALPGAEALAEQARALGVASLEADAHLLVAWIRSPLGEPAETESRFREAIRAAARANDPRREAVLWLGMTRVVANHRGDPERAAQLLFPAELAVAASGDTGVRVRWLTESSDVARIRGELEVSLANARDALRLVARVDEPDLGLEAQVHKQLSIALTLLDRPREALPYARREYELRRDELGERHPYAAYSLTTVGGVLTAAGEYRAAVEHCRRAKELLQAAFPAENFAVFMSRVHLGEAAYHLGDLDLAEREMSEARAGLARQLGPSHPQTLSAAATLAAIEVRRGAVAEGERRARDVVAALAELGDEAEMIAFPAHRTLAEALRLQGRHAEAEAELAALAERAAGVFHDTHRWHGVIATERGMNALAAGKVAESIPLFERGVAVLAAGEVKASPLARAEAGLARALWARGDRERSIALATRAEKRFARSGVVADGELGELRAWRAARASE